jgi:hypothetical protein
MHSEISRNTPLPPRHPLSQSTFPWLTRPHEQMHMIGHQHILAHLPLTAITPYAIESHCGCFCGEIRAPGSRNNGEKYYRSRPVKALNVRCWLPTADRVFGISSVHMHLFVEYRQRLRRHIEKSNKKREGVSLTRPVANPNPSYIARHLRGG